MYENIKIGILGGDMRQAVLAGRLSSLGFEVAVWGFSQNSDISGAVRCADFASAIKSADAIVLPLPVSRDGVTLNCPMMPHKGQYLKSSATRTLQLEQ